MTQGLRPETGFLNLRIEIKERFQTTLQLFFNFFLAAFQHVHGHMRLASIFQFQGGIADFGDFLRGQKPQSIDEGQIRHDSILFSLARLLKCAVLRKTLPILIALGFALSAAAQQPSPPSAQPPVKVNVLNVCSPSPEEQQEIAAALARVPKQPLFTQDFEVDRGRSVLDQKPTFLQQGDMAQVSSGSATATWVRIRREFSVQAMFSTVQYSFSEDAKDMDETLVFHVRDPKEFLEVAIEDTASSVTTPAAMLTTNTPANRIKLERFGKSVEWCWPAARVLKPAPLRTRAPTNRCFRLPLRSWPIIAACWVHLAPCPTS